MVEEWGLRWSADLRACSISAVEEVRDQSEATGGDFVVGLRVILAVEGLEGGCFLVAKAGLVIHKRIVEKLLAGTGHEKRPNDWRGCVELIYGRNMNKLLQPFTKQWCIDDGSWL